MTERSFCRSTDRTAEDMVDEMLAKGRTWIDILAVASSTRRGQWRQEAERLLYEMGVIPPSFEERNAQVLEDRKRKPLGEECPASRVGKRRKRGPLVPVTGDQA